MLKTSLGFAPGGKRYPLAFVYYAWQVRPMLGTLYAIIATGATPFLKAYLKQRQRRGKEHPQRIAERFGITNKPRPQGSLLWAHAASVGEAMSLRPILDCIHSDYPDVHVLVTTGTVASAAILEPILPRGMIHQFVPIDHPPSVKRFLDHWNPHMALWVESEIWPTLMTALSARHIPTVLLNGRMSPASFRRWLWVRQWAKKLFAHFDLCLTQTEEDAHFFEQLGAHKVRAIGNMKYAAAPLPSDETALKALRDVCGQRPCWLFASTHKGEEELALSIDQQLRPLYPDLLTILVPRHAPRGDTIAAFFQQHGYSVQQRSHSATAPLSSRIAIYLADTMGELGTFYRLCPLVVMGGSFVPIGGHNPIEPAQLGCAILWGPHMHNFAKTRQEFVTANAAQQFNDINELAKALARHLATPEQTKAYAERAQQFVATKAHIRTIVMEALAPYLTKIQQKNHV